MPNTDFTIPKGMRVYVPVLGIHSDETFFSNPEKFDPERFSGGDSDAFMPFGDGMCVFFFTISSLFCAYFVIIHLFS